MQLGAGWATTVKRSSNRWIGVAVTAAAILALALSFSPMATAQVVGGTVSGVVTDSSGSLVPSATISIKNVGTGLLREAQSNDAGFYTITNLIPGEYVVTISAAGFKTILESHLILAVGEQRELNQVLQVGQITETVSVTSSEQSVDLVSSGISNDVSPTTIRELPLNGRDWTQLATLEPGVSQVRTQASVESATANREQRGFGNQIAISGHRPQDNNYRVNGISDMDYANSSPGSVIGVALGVDAIQEFSVLTSNFDAQYGRSDSGIINAVMRSGTNSFHGDGYVFVRDQSLDARNFFDPAKIPPFHRNQFGGSGGGPIIKNKTFFFVAYEGIRQNKTFSFNDNVPSIAARNGTLCSVPVNGCTTFQLPVGPNTNPNGVDLNVVPFFGLYPLPNAGTIGNGDTGIFKSSQPAIFSQNYFSVRGDHKFSDKDALALSYTYDKGPFTQPDPFGDVVNENETFRQLATIEETHLFSSTFVNSFRVGYDRAVGLSNIPFKALNPLADDTSLGALPGRNAPIVNVSGLTQLAGSLGAASAIESTWNSFQFYDDASWSHGVHSIKFGFAAERMQYNETNSNSLNGLFTFGSLQNFLQNIPASVRLTDSSKNQPFGSRQTLYGAYIQDDWHVKQNLTINLGMRYEPATLPTEVHNQYQVVLDIFGGLPQPVHTLWKNNATLTNFAPRLGLAWDPFKDGKTAVRAAFGIYDQSPLLWEYSHENSPAVPFAFNVTSSTIPPGSFPSGATDVLGGFTIKNAIVRYIPQDPPHSFSMNWNVNIQHQFAPSLTATVGYVGVKSIGDVVSYDDWNAVLPTKTSIGYLWPTPIGSGTRIDPNVGTLRATNWGGRSSYNAVIAQILKRMSNGLQFQASYTFGKCLDYGSGSSIGDPFQNSIANLPFFAPELTHGQCDYNIAQTLVANTVYQLPVPKSKGAFVEHVAGGWQVGAILTATSGSPFTLLIAGDPLGQLSEPFDYPDRLPNCNAITSNYGNSPVPHYLNVSCFTVPTAPASFAAQCVPFASTTTPNSCRNLYGDAGRNQINGPGLVNLDFSLVKNNYIPKISEAFNVQFRAEFFNILNHTNFEPPLGTNILFNTNGTTVASGGTLTATATDSRQIQFAVKIIF
jgi:hypothetical protein